MPSRLTTSSSTSRPSSVGAVLEDRGVAVDDHVVAEAAGGEVAQHDLGTDAGRIAHRDRHRLASSSLLARSTVGQEVDQRVPVPEAAGLRDHQRPAAVGAP